MLSQALRDAFNKSNDWISNKNQLGSELSKAVNCVKGNWKFSRDGGAVSDITLKGLDGVETVKIPNGAIVTHAFVYVKSAVTSGGSLTLDLNLQSATANDLLAGTAVASLTLGAKIQGIPTQQTVSTYVVTTAERTLGLSFNVAAATAGEIDVYVYYVY